MKTKKDAVKDFIRDCESPFSARQLHRTLTGVWSGARWHKAILDVSLSTVRNALEELVESGEYQSYYAIGHCFDEKLYKEVEYESN